MSATDNQRWTTYRNNAVTSTTILVRSGPCDVYGYSINNPNASTAFIQLFNAAATGDVNLGTTVCDEGIQLPISGPVVEAPNTDPILSFPLGLVIAATTTEGGNTAPGSAVSVVLRFQ